MSLIKPIVTTLFHTTTSTSCYIINCPNTLKACVIDSVMDYDDISRRTSDTHVNQVIDTITNQGLELVYIMETHVHADHLTGAQLLKNRFPNAQTCIGENVTEVQQTFSRVFNIDIECDGSQFDKLWTDNEEFQIGDLQCRVIHTPGHTPACVTYIIGDAVFTGDTIFMPDFGTARCDFPGGSASLLYDSVQKILSLPDQYRAFVGHDYAPGGREIAWETTIGQLKQSNIHVKIGTDKKQFVEWRQARDSTLQPPRLLMQSLQVNLVNGRLPTPEVNGIAYLKIPINV